MSVASKYVGVGSFVIFTLLPLLCTSAVTYYLYTHQENLAAFSVLQWSLLSGILMFACAFAICPPTFLAIVMGFFLGWAAFPYLVFINLGAIILIYSLYRLINFSWIENKLLANPKIRKTLDGIKNDELKLIFFTKLSPLFPFAVTNLVFAVSGARFSNILLGGFLGMVPRTLLAVYVGKEANVLSQLIDNPNEGTLSKVIISALLVVSAVGMYIIIKKALEKNI